jgi:hypothetical protein
VMYLRNLKKKTIFGLLNKNKKGEAGGQLTEEVRKDPVLVL